MDRNSITGIILIALLFIAYQSMFVDEVGNNGKTTSQDSTNTPVIVNELTEEISTSETLITINESLSSQESINKYGAFAKNANGSDNAIVI